MNKYFPPAHPDKKRIAAVADLRKGMRPAEVSRKHRVKVQTISTWKKRYITDVDGHDPGHPTFTAKKPAKKSKLKPIKQYRQSHDDIEQMTDKLLAFWRKPLGETIRKLIELAVERRLESAKTGVLAALRAP